MKHIVLILPIAFLMNFSTPIQAQTLADEVAGTYEGKFGKNGNMSNGHKIKITKLTDTSVTVSPESGSGSTTFEAELTERMVGSIRTISFSSSVDVMLQNATFESTQARFAYAIIKVVNDEREIEVFSGKKE